MGGIIPSLVLLRLCVRLCVLRRDEQGVSPDLVAFMQVSWSG